MNEDKERTIEFQNQTYLRKFWFISPRTKLRTRRKRPSLTEDIKDREGVSVCHDASQMVRKPPSRVEAYLKEEVENSQRIKTIILKRDE